MRLSAIVVLAVAMTSMAGPIMTEYALEARGDKNGATWQTTPSDKRYHQASGGKLQPQPEEPADHLTYRKKDEKVTNYQGWTENPYTGKMTDNGRWRGEGKSHGGIEPPIYYPPKGKAIPAGKEHEPKSRTPSPHNNNPTRRSLSEEDTLEARGDKNGATWQTTPSDKRYHQASGGKLQPQPEEPADHLTYRKKDEKVTNYQGWTENPYTGKMTDNGRWRGEGKSHGGIEPPIYYPPKGKAIPAGKEHEPKSRTPSPHNDRPTR